MGLRPDFVFCDIGLPDLSGYEVAPYQPIPGMGAFGIFVDPTGAALGVWEPAPKKPAKKAKKK